MLIANIVQYCSEKSMFVVYYGHSGALFLFRCQTLVARVTLPRVPLGNHEAPGGRKALAYRSSAGWRRSVPHSKVPSLIY